MEIEPRTDYDRRFIPDHLLLKSILLFDRCKCDDCQSEKRKREDMLMRKNTGEK